LRDYTQNAITLNEVQVGLWKVLDEGRCGGETIERKWRCDNQCRKSERTLVAGQ